MNKLIPKKTKKLFYNEYPYKISTRVAGATHLRTWSLSKLIQWCTDGNPLDEDRTRLWWDKKRELKTDKKEELLKFCIILNSFSDKEYKFRIERSTFNIFVKDKDLFHKMLTALNPFVKEYFEPENDEVLSALLSKKKIIVCDEIPHGMYKYKITLKGGNHPGIIEWADKYPEEKVYVTSSNRKILSDGHPYYDPWIYVGDEKMLMMINFAVSGKVRSCYEFVSKSNINISS